MKTETKHKIEVGQILWVRRSNHYRTKTEPFAVKVSKVGNKYFEVESDLYYKAKFDLSNLQLVNETNYVDQLYFTLQEILDENESIQLASKFRQFFGAYGKLNLTLGQLRKIQSIIEEPKQTT